ncbi:MAG: S-methyl-5-thioribose-1-phosphate isomerase [Oscillospiraceae bacterium]|jgi:methylthioribose-1-phosphate isomerase|nr:S-methyl-5-thioribose-1-phosphate isomerase [Oscillospiraceae bacterium]
MNREYDTVSLDDERGVLVAIDQTKLPNALEFLALSTPPDIRDAIRSLQIRGAPAIGVAAAFGYYLAARNAAVSGDALWEALREAKQTLASSRPTAVNLFWALERMERSAFSCPDRQNLIQRLKAEAVSIRDEDVASCRAIGGYGLTLLKDGDGILTHCNAGRLAAVRYGTALAPVYVGAERGARFKVYATETRPLMQGARLTAYELSAAGIDVTLICDNMASRVMRNGWVRAVITGCDRVAANGDVCNKIGTSALAVLAAHYSIPFYVCAPLSTVDLRTASGDEIPIEERDGGEVSEMWFQKPSAPAGVKIYNPSFDVTPHSLVSAIVTERGVLRAPYAESLRGAKHS